MGEPLTPEEARAAAEKIDRTADRTRHLADPIAATLRAYADQSERLKEIEEAVGEYLNTVGTAAPSSLRDRALVRLRSLVEEGE